MNVYFLTNRFGETVVYHLKNLTVDVINKLGIVYEIGEMKVVLDRHTNLIGHMASDIEEIKEIISHYPPSDIGTLTPEDIDEILNS